MEAHVLVLKYHVYIIRLCRNFCSSVTKQSRDFHLNNFIRRFSAYNCISDVSPKQEVNSNLLSDCGSSSQQKLSNVTCNEIGNKNNDYLGIENDEGVKYIDDNKLIAVEKHKYLLEKRDLKPSDERMMITSFGNVRLDAHNQVKDHGQFDENIPYDPNLYHRMKKRRSNLKILTEEDVYKINALKKSSMKSKPTFKIESNNDMSKNANTEQSSKEVRDRKYVDTTTMIMHDTEAPFFDLESSISNNIQKQNPLTHSDSRVNNKHYPNLETHSEKKEHSFDKSELYFKKMINNAAMFQSGKQCLNQNNSEQFSENEYSYVDEYSNEVNISNADNFSELTQMYVPGKTISEHINSVKHEGSVDADISYIDKLHFNEITKDEDKLYFNKFSKEKLEINDEIGKGITNVNSIYLKDGAKKYAFKEKVNVLQSNSPQNEQNRTLNFTSVVEEPEFISKDLQQRTKYDVDENNTVSNNCNLKSYVKPDIDNPKTAYDYVMKMRREKKVNLEAVKKDETVSLKPEYSKKLQKSSLTSFKLDSKGYRIFKDQVINLKYLPRDDIVQMLKQSVLYNDDDILVLNKPYGMVCHESESTKEPSLSSFLGDLAQAIEKRDPSPELYTVHRLDKETTGCLVLAKNQKTSQFLKSLFAQRKITKVYWILTTRIPDPPEGIINIPITEGKIDGKIRMALHPESLEKQFAVGNSKKAKKAVTYYKVIASAGNAALVEVRPETGYKHQIRAHLGFGLNCPILGDHKYSHLNKLAPQTLTGDLLDRLQVRQSKARYIPMHIHAHSILVPEILDGRNLFVKAQLPSHFVSNMKSLRIRKD